MTTRSVVQAALRQYLDRTDDKMLLLRRLNQLGRAWNRTQRDLEIHMEAFAIYVKLWLRTLRTSPTTRRTPPAEKPRAASPNSRSTPWNNSRAAAAFAEDLPREVIADEAELSKMAGEASAPPAGGAAPSGKR